MSNVHKEEYNIDGKDVAVVADLLNNKVYIYAKGIKLEFDLDEYTNFYGNMRDFVAHHIGLENN